MLATALGAEALGVDVSMWFVVLLLLSQTHAWVTRHRLSRQRRWMVKDSNRQEARAGFYIEEEEVKNVREFWETNPFETANRLVESFVAGQLDFVVDATSTLVQIEEQLQSRKPTRLAQGNRKRRQASFRIDFCYNGRAFCGWQRQKEHDKPSVQQSVEDALESVLGHRVNVRVAGRTDAGVHAIGQVGRFRTLDWNQTAESIASELQLRSSTDSSWRCLSIEPASYKFHPMFGAQCRSYVYLIDTDNSFSAYFGDPSVVVRQLDQLLRRLEGQALDYFGLSQGKLETTSTTCTLFTARAVLLRRSMGELAPIAICLTGDRFLRRMVRVLVGTALWLVNDDNPNALLECVRSCDRRLAGPAAPPNGLIFMSAAVPT